MSELRILQMEIYSRILTTDATVDIAVWSSVEGGLAITAGSLACGRPLFRLILSRIGFSSAPYIVPSNEALAAAHPPTVGSGPVPRGSRRSRGTELLSLGSIFTGTGGQGDRDSSEDLKLTSPATRSDYGERKPRHTPIQVTIEEHMGVEAPTSEHPRRGRSSASDGTFSSRRELRQEV